MVKRKETAEEREARVARLQELYRSGQIDSVLIPPDADVGALVDDITSGSSEAERRLLDLLRKTRDG
jgi:hypothetical protein